MIHWEEIHRAGMPHYLEAQRRGRRVRVLEDRPRLPAHLGVVAQARADIGGESDLASVVAWFRAAGIDPEPERFFWLLDRIRAVEAVHRDSEGKTLRPRGVGPPTKNAPAQDSAAGAHRGNA